MRQNKEREAQTCESRQMQYDRKTKTKTNRGKDREIKKDREGEWDNKPTFDKDPL